ncbi:MAG: hypothetical protein AAGM84_15755 [Pseudomonadota bacterium]
MFAKKFTAGLAAATLALATSAAAQSVEYWGEAGGWAVLVDPSLGYGCFLQAEYDNGALVRIGFDRNVGAGYVTAFNYDWGDIEEGAAYEVGFALDGEYYTGEAVGIYVEDVPGADIYFDNPDFLWDIAKKYTMTFYNEGGEVMAIDLGGTFVGLEAILECQDEYG